MKLRALVLAFGIFLLPCIASAQPTPPHVPTQTSPCPNGGGPPNIYVLSFDPGAAFTNPQGYTFPPNFVPLTAGTAMYNDLQQAWAIAPLFLQKLLCGLDGIFINTEGCNSFDSTNDVCPGPLNSIQTIEASWGFREIPSLFPPSSQPSQYNRYIAISAGPWYTKGGSGSGVPGVNAPKYSVYEQSILDQLLPWSSTTKPTYGAANPGADIPAMAVLAALAHEFGHVLWYDTFRPSPPPGGPYDWSTFCHGTFFTNSWRHVDAPPTWRIFGMIQNSHHPSAIAIQDIVIALLHQDFQSAGNLIQGNNPVQGSNLQGIYNSNGRWASMFAAFSPDEDFVETFKFYVLTKAVGMDNNNNPHALNYLPIKVTGSTTQTYNIPDDYSNNRKTELSRKVACIQEQFNPRP